MIITMLNIIPRLIRPIKSFYPPYALMHRGNLTNQVNNDLVNNRIGLDTDYEQKAVKSKLVKNLQLSDEEANFAVFKIYNSTARLESERQFDSKIGLIKKHFQHTDICHNLEIIGMSHKDLENRINIFVELGFEQIELKLLNLLPQLMSKTPLELKKAGLYPQNTNPRQNILRHLQSKKLFSIPSSKMPVFQESDDSLQLSELRSECLLFILQQMFKSSEQVATHIVERFNEQQIFDQMSFTNLITMLNILSKVVNLSNDTLLKYFHSLLNCDLDNLIQLINIPLLKSNKNFQFAFFSRPRLIQISALEIQERIELLMNEYKCTALQLKNCPYILESTLDETRAKFNKFKQCEQLNVYANNPALLRLITEIDLVLRNISILDEKNISTKDIAIHNLLKTNSSFKNMVKNGTFQLTMNSFTQMHFGTPLKDIKHKIGGNWIFYKFDSLHAAPIVNYFRQQGLSDAQIQNAFYITSFSLETIKTIWEEMFQYESVNRSSIDWRNHPLVLQLLHYFIARRQKA